jgi:hypothetical protein
MIFRKPTSIRLPSVAAGSFRRSPGLFPKVSIRQEILNSQKAGTVREEEKSALYAFAGGTHGCISRAA